MKQNQDGGSRDCKAVRLLLDAYSSTELDAVQSSAIEAHLVSCTACRAEYEALVTTRQVLAHYPLIQASPDFNARVLDQLAYQHAHPASFYDRLDILFARPLYKLIGSAALSVVVGLLTLALVAGPTTLRGRGYPGFLTIMPQSLTATTSPDIILNPLFATSNLSADLGPQYPSVSPPAAPIPVASIPVAPAPLTSPPTPPSVPAKPKGGEPAWKPPRKTSSGAASGFSFSALSGASC